MARYRRYAEALRPLCHQQVADQRPGRSEEHTSELQSRLHLVCRLLLEKTNSRTVRGHTRSPTSRVSGHDITSWISWTNGNALPTAEKCPHTGVATSEP